MGVSNFDQIALGAGLTCDSALQLIAGDGTIVLPTSPGIIKTVVLTKGSAAAITLPAPTIDGLILLVYSETAFAHVITCSVGFKRKGSSGTATFTGVADNFFEIISRNGQWNAGAQLNTTFA